MGDPEVDGARGVGAVAGRPYGGRFAISHHAYVVGAHDGAGGGQPHRSNRPHLEGVVSNRKADVVVTSALTKVNPQQHAQRGDPYGVVGKCSVWSECLTLKAPGEPRQRRKEADVREKRLTHATVIEQDR